MLNDVVGNVLSISFSALAEVDICLCLSMAFDDSEEHIVEYSLPKLLHTRIILGSVLKCIFLELI